MAIGKIRGIFLLALFSLVSAAAFPASPTVNRPPRAEAGADQTTYVGVTVTLDGSASTDPDGDSLQFSWSVVSAPPGAQVQIANAVAVRPTLSLPAAGSYTLRLIVHDGDVNSAADTVTLTTANSAPVANAGDDQSVSAGSGVVLNGSRSSDVDGDALTYEWQLMEKPQGSAAVLQDADPTSPVADFVVDAEGRYVARLTVRDAESESASDSTIVSTDNSAPSANAGHDRTSSLGEWVEISGGESSDVDRDALSYRWSLTRPASSSATLRESTGPQTGFAPDVPGSYVVQLIVNDGARDSEPDTVAVSTDNSRPVAFAYAEVFGSAYVNDPIYFNGYYSYDPDGGALTFSWSVLSSPAGSSATLNSAQSPMPSLVPDLPGVYVVQLIVGDGSLDSVPVTAEVTAVIRDDPVIVVENPPQGSWINHSSVTIAGYVSKPATLWVYEGEVQVPLDDDYRFEYQINLVEGFNVVDFYAVDDTGNAGYLSWQLYLDTVPPPAPQLPLIIVDAEPDGRLIVRGDPGAVSAYGAVRVTNVRTGEAVTVQVDGNGNFEVELGGVESDNVSVVAIDRAQNESDPLVVPGIGSGELAIEIAAPVDDATVTSASIVISGLLFGPIDAGVSVNDRPAELLEDRATRSFSSLVNLWPGVNTIAIVAKRPNGASVTEQLLVTRTGSPAFSVDASPAAGPAPLDVMFQITQFQQADISRVEIDLDADGVIDITQQGDNRYIPARYEEVGYFESQVRITTDSDVVTVVVPVTVQTLNQIDVQIQRVWTAVVRALRAGDAATALTHFTAESAGRYGPVFQQIGSDLPTVGNGFGSITLAKVSGPLVEYVIVRNVNGMDQAFLISFWRGRDGTWRVLSL